MDFKVGEFVIVYNIDRNKKLVGKINEIKDEKILIFTIYAMPEDLPMGRQQYHSAFELIRTDETAKEFVENAIKKVEVLRLQDFKQRFKHPAKELSHIKTPLSNQTVDDADVFFFRQRFTRVNSSTASSIPGKQTQQGTYAPELKQSCLCRKILNPDDETIMCENCSSLLHPQCLRQNADRKCYECGKEVPIKAIYSLKRQALMKDDEEEEQKDQGETLSAVEGDQFRDIKRQRLDAASTIPQQIETEATTVTAKSAFPSLKNQETAKKLDEHVNQIRQNSENYNLINSVSGVQKTRKNVRENFAIALMLGLEESKERGDFNKIQGASESDKEDEKYLVCMNLALNIESHMWVLYDESISKEYSSKYRQLHTALRNDENYELRLKILMGEIEPSQVPDLSVNDLASKIQQEKKEMQQKKFFEEQVVVNEPLQIIVRSHKGSEILQLNVDERKVISQEEVSGSLQQNLQSMGSIQQAAPSSNLVQDSVKTAQDQAESADSVGQAQINRQKDSSTQNQTEDLKQSEDAQTLEPRVVSQVYPASFLAEHRELLDDLNSRWSMKSLTQKFLDRLNGHLKANILTRDDLVKKVQDMSGLYEKHQQKIILKIKGSSIEKQQQENH
eukprot:403356500